MSKLKAVGHWILVKPDRVETKSKGGIHYADTTIAGEQAGVWKGTLVGIGPTAWKDPRLGGEPWASVGDRICWPRYAGKPFPPGETFPDYQILADEDVMAVILED